MSDHRTYVDVCTTRDTKVTKFGSEIAYYRIDVHLDFTARSALEVYHVPGESWTVALSKLIERGIVATIRDEVGRR